MCNMVEKMSGKLLLPVIKKKIQLSVGLIAALLELIGDYFAL